MKPLELLAILVLGAALTSCGKEADVSSSVPDASSDKMTDNEGIAYLEGRGHSVTLQDAGGYYVTLNAKQEPYEVLAEDALALNSIGKLVGLRTLPSIKPDVMQILKVFPDVKEFAVHYEFPDESLKYLTRFPNVEKMTFWGDDYGSFETFPALSKLKIFENEGTNDKFTVETARRLAACRNLEEVMISQPIPQEGIEILKSLPNLKYLGVAGENIIGGEQRGVE